MARRRLLFYYPNDWPDKRVIRKHISPRELHLDDGTVTLHQIGNLDQIPRYEDTVTVSPRELLEEIPVIIVARLAYVGTFETDDGPEIKWRLELHSPSREEVVKVLLKNRRLVEDLLITAATKAVDGLLSNFPIFNGAYVLAWVGLNRDGVIFSGVYGLSGIDTPTNQKALERRNRELLWGNFSAVFRNIKGIVNGTWQPPDGYLNLKIDPWKDPLAVQTMENTVFDPFLRAIYALFETWYDGDQYLRTEVRKKAPRAPHSGTTRYEEDRPVPLTSQVDPAYALSICDDGLEEV